MASAAKSAALYAAAYIGVRGIINLTKQAIEAFGIQERAEKKLEVALGGVNQSLLKQASALQQLTTFGDEAIIGVQASIAAFTDNEEAIKRATEATLDMAAATGMDLKAAGDLVAKSLGSSTNALSRYGIEVTGAVGSTERLDTLVGNIADKFAGQAAASAETMAGKMQQASNAVGDAAEAVGGLFAPAVKISAEAVKFLAEGLGDTVKGLQGIELIAQKFDLLTISQSSAAQELEVFKESIRTLTHEEMQALGDSMAETVEVGAVWTEESQLLADKMLALNEAMGIVSASGIKDHVTGFQDINVAMGEFNLLLSSGIPLMEELPPIANDIKFNFEDLTAATDMYVDSMVGAIVHGQSMKDALISSSKALTVQLIADFIKRKIAASTTLAATVAETITAAKAIGLAWATPSALAATATGGISAATGLAALTATVSGANALATFAATGADFVTNGPQLMVVGESGREKVQVTPLEGPNINGPQGGNTFIFNGDIIGSDEYIDNNMIPAINLAVTQGRSALA
jgi:hypothetical protein